MKILVIDNAYLVRYTLARILRRQGYEVVTAADGERGMAVFRSATPDIVIADIMPEEKGCATIRQMRSERPDAKIIAISGSGEIGNSDRPAMARKLGADDVIGKPFDAAELLSRVRQLHVSLDQDGGAAA